VAGSAAGIVSTLEAFGFEWDGELVHQRNRLQDYARALKTLEARALTFECCCSRLQLEEEIRYPGTCRERPAGSGIATATRLRVEPGFIEFCDRIQGRFRQDIAAAVGDMILRRRDQVFAYLLAVVIDDAAQGVTHVVRGADLLDNTPRQIYLQRALGLSQPAYAHVPVLTEPDDSKLAKSRHSVRLAADSVLPQLLRVFSLLGLTTPPSLAGAGLAQAWQWAIEHWSVKKVSSQLTVRISNQQSMQ
jgi:glutamyl-Q tRNA(Asp) synthetase